MNCTIPAGVSGAAGKWRAARVLTYPRTVMSGVLSSCARKPSVSRRAATLPSFSARSNACARCRAMASRSASRVRRFVQRFLQDAQHLALVHRGDGHVLLGIGRDQQPHQMPEIALHGSQQLHSVALGHSVVGDQHGEFLAAFAQQYECLADAVGGHHAELAAEGPGEPLARCGFVIDEEDGVGFAGRAT